MIPPTALATAAATAFATAVAAHASGRVAVASIVAAPYGGDATQMLTMAVIACGALA